MILCWQSIIRIYLSWTYNNTSHRYEQQKAKDKINVVKLTKPMQVSCKATRTVSAANNYTKLGIQESPKFMTLQLVHVYNKNFTHVVLKCWSISDNHLHFTAIYIHKQTHNNNACCKIHEVDKYHIKKQFNIQSMWSASVAQPRLFLHPQLLWIYEWVVGNHDTPRWRDMDSLQPQIVFPHHWC